MRFFFLLVCLGAAYGLAVPFVGEGTTASLIAWPLGIALFFGLRFSWRRVRPFAWRIEDWDFRHCHIQDPRYDVVTCAYFSRHFTEVVAVDAVRLNILAPLIEHEPGVVTADQEYVILGDFGEGYLRGRLSIRDFFSSDGRFFRRVVKSLSRESQKYGQVRLTLLPALPGLADRPSDATPDVDGC